MACSRIVPAEEEALWNYLVDRYHYLGHPAIVGAYLKYMAFWEDRPVACLGWGSGAVVGYLTSISHSHTIPHQTEYLTRGPLPCLWISPFSSSCLSLFRAVFWWIFKFAAISLLPKGIPCLISLKISSRSGDMVKWALKIIVLKKLPVSSNFGSGNAFVLHVSFILIMPVPNCSTYPASRNIFTINLFLTSDIPSPKSWRVIPDGSVPGLVISILSEKISSLLSDPVI